MKFHTAIFTAAMFLIFSLFSFNAFAANHSQSMHNVTYMLMADNDTDIELEQYDTEEDFDEDTEDAYEEEEEDNSEDMLQDDIESDDESESDVEDKMGTDEEDVAQKLGAALDQAGQEETQAVQAGTIPPECATAAGHIIIMLDEHGINNGIAYIKPEAEVEFSNQSGETHKITISPAGFVDQNSFTVAPHRSASVYASSPSSVTVGKVNVTTNGTHTKYFLVICP